MDKKTLRALAALIAFGLALYWCTQNISSVQSVLSFLWGIIFPFVLGLIITFLVNIPMSAIEKKLFRGKTKRWVRPVSYLLALVCILIALSLFMALVVPQLVVSIKTLVSSMPGYMADLQLWAAPYAKYLPMLEELLEALNMTWSDFLPDIIAFLQGAAGGMVTSAFGFATGLLNGTTNFVIGFMFSIYVLMQKERLLIQLKGVLKAFLPPAAYSETTEIASMSLSIFSRFVSGQLLESLVVWVLFSLALWIGGFHYYFLIGGLIGIMTLVPMFGGIISTVVGAFLVLSAQGFWRMFAFLIVVIVLQQIDNNVIYPHIMGSSVGLPAIWVLPSVVICSSLLGFSGIFLSVPLASICYSLLRRNTLRRLRKTDPDNPLLDTPQPPPTRAKFWQKKASATAQEPAKNNAGTNVGTAHLPPDASKSMADDRGIPATPAADLANKAGHKNKAPATKASKSRPKTPNKT